MLKKKLSRSLSLVIGVSMLFNLTGFSLTAHAATVTLADGDYATIQNAINAAAVGDTIVIPAGTFTYSTSQTVNVNKSLEIRGAGMDATILQGSGGSENQNRIFRISANNVKISDLKFQGLPQGSGAVLDVGLEIGNVANFVVKNAKFENFGDSAVKVNGADSKGVITSSKFINNYRLELHNYGYGVVVYGGGNVNWNRPYALGTENAVFVEDNYFIGNRHNIASNNGSNYVFRYNTLADDAEDFYPIDSHGKGSWDRGSRSFEIYGNTITTSYPAPWAMGIRGGDGVIFNNKINGNFTGTAAQPIFLMIENNSTVYPTQDQTRDLYIWDNTYNGATAGVVAEIPSMLQQDRDYYLTSKSGYTPYVYPHPLANSPFTPALDGPTNVALNKTAITSNSTPINSSRLTDGDKSSSNYVDMQTDTANWIQVDLGQSYDINDIKLWHYFSGERTYHDVVVQVSNDPTFATKTTVFNNDTDNSAGQGIGSDDEYAETSTGKDIPFAATSARYVRLWLNGSSVNDFSHYVEVEVWAVPTATPTPAPTATPTAPPTPTPTPALFQNKVVYGIQGTGTNEISNPPSGYTADPNFAADFNSYFNQQFSSQPLPVAVVPPSSVTAGNKLISQNGNNIALPRELYTGTVSISNSYGTMSIGDSSTIGSTVLYGGSSCTIGATSNLTIYGDVVCNGPITFTGNITGLTIHGNVIAAGDITFNSSVGSFTIDKTLSAQGSINFKGSNIAAGTINGDLIGHGISFHGFSSLSVAGNVSSTQDFMPSTGNYTSFQIGKSLYVTGNSQISTLDKMVIGGSYYGKGSIDFHNQISSNGLTVGKSLLSDSSITFHGIGAPVNVGNFLGALNQLNFNNNISGNVNLGGIAAGQVNIYNNFAPPNIYINYNPPAPVIPPTFTLASRGTWYSKTDFIAGGYGLGTNNTGTPVTLEYDATPAAANINGFMGFTGSYVVPSAFSSYAIIVRLNLEGTIDARNADDYAAVNSVNYTAHTQYHFKIVANLSTNTYDAWVTPAGGTAIQIASGYAFRSDAPNMTDIGTFGLINSDGDNLNQVNNFTINGVPMPVSVS